MKYFMSAIAALAMLFTASLASADEMNGTVAEVDQNQGVLILDTGEIFTVAEGTSLEGLSPGTEVTVSFEIKEDGQKVADQVLPAQ